ncbi:hypothetical protein Neosp_014822 [[Neocosmospora] mangrovei]
MTQSSSPDPKSHQSTKEMDNIEAGIGNPANNDVAEGKVQDIVFDTINAADGQYTETDYKRVLWKIDLVLLPLMWLCYGTQQADKTSISTQATFGMREDNGLAGQQFSFPACCG